jgi:phosphoglycolate phosphatase-like HAD superfamily hydrolase
MIVAFDFDGTVCDSMGALEDLAITVIRRYWDVADEAPLRQRYRDTAGDPFDVQFPRIVSSSGYEVSVATAEYAIEKIGVTLRSQPKKDTIAAIERLLDARVGVHIISSTRAPLIRMWLREHFEALEPFVHCHGIDMGTKVENLRRCRPDWFVGDSVSDQMRAAQVGVTFFHVDEINDFLAEVL